MTLRKMRFLVLGLGFFAAPSLGWADASSVDRNYTGPVNDPAQVCMIKRTVQPHTSYVESYQGKTYHFCCTMCQSRFRTDPEKEKIAIDPVSHKPVDKADALIYSYQGRAYFFGSERNRNKFAKRPTRYPEKQ